MKIKKKNVHFILFFNHVQCTCIYINAIWSTHIPLSIKVYTPKSRKMLTLYEFQIIYLNLCKKSPNKIHFTFKSIILIQFHVVCRYLTVNNNPIYIRLCFWLVNVFSLHYPWLQNAVLLLMIIRFNVLLITYLTSSTILIMI